MLAGLTEGLPLIDREPLPRLFAVEDAETLQNLEDQQLASLAEAMCEKSIPSGSDTEKDDGPLQGYRELKWLLIGDVRPVARLNMHYPPGVERMTHRGRRVYGVECAVKIDPETGDVFILRKDDIPNSADPTDWFVVTGNLKTGVFDKREVVMTDIQKGENGDKLSLQVAPVAHPNNAYRGYTTVTAQLSPTYQSVGDVIATRRPYYGRGVGPEPNLIVEGEYTTDIYALHQALEQELSRRGLSPELLNHRQDPKVALGQYALKN